MERWPKTRKQINRCNELYLLNRAGPLWAIFWQPGCKKSNLSAARWQLGAPCAAPSARVPLISWVVGLFLSRTCLPHSNTSPFHISFSRQTPDTAWGFFPRSGRVVFIPVSGDRSLDVPPPSLNVVSDHRVRELCSRPQPGPWILVFSFEGV